MNERDENSLAEQIVEQNQRVDRDPVSPEKIDTKDEIIQLEKNHYALEYIQRWYSNPDVNEREKALSPITSSNHHVEVINNQFAKRMLLAFMQEESSAGLQLFRDISPYTIDEELALLIHDTDFIQIHKSIKELIHDSKDVIASDVDQRLSYPNGQIAWNDRYQFNGAESKRSLNNIESTGISVEVGAESVERIKAAHQASEGTHLPITEILKNDKIVGINGFTDSKVSHVIHDAIDHV
jgi:hypothetical protein